MSLIKLADELQNPTGQIVRYALRGPHPPIAATVAVAAAFRSAVLSSLHATTGSKESFVLSGHHPDGKPDKEHRHAYYLPQPDETGRIRELLVVSPFDRFIPEELTALQTVQALQWNGPSTKTRIELLESNDRSTIRLARRWVSLTPYVPSRRFWGTHGKHHLTPDKQVSSELKRVIPQSAIEEVKLTPWSDVRVRVAPSSMANCPDTPARRLAYGVEFTVVAPLCAPIALGHTCHFGLGQFVAAGNE